MSYAIEYTPQAEDDVAHFRKSGNKPLIKKLITLIGELAEHPYTGTGQPEKLKHNRSGYWSRRINQEHRLVYAVEENIVTVTVVSAKGHYEE